MRGAFESSSTRRPKQESRLQKGDGLVMYWRLELEGVDSDHTEMGRESASFLIPQTTPQPRPIARFRFQSRSRSRSRR